MRGLNCAVRALVPFLWVRCVDLHNTVEPELFQKPFALGKGRGWSWGRGLGGREGTGWALLGRQFKHTCARIFSSTYSLLHILSHTFPSTAIVLFAHVPFHTYRKFCVNIVNTDELCEILKFTLSWWGFKLNVMRCRTTAWS